MLQKVAPAKMGPNLIDNIVELFHAQLESSRNTFESSRALHIDSICEHRDMVCALIFQKFLDRPGWQISKFS